MKNLKERHIITIGIDPTVYELLKEYSDMSGVHIKRLASTAIAKWLREEQGIQIEYPRLRSNHLLAAQQPKTQRRRATDAAPQPATPTPTTAA